MKKSYLVVLIIIAIGVAAIIAPMYPSSSLRIFENWGLVATLLVILSVIAFFFEFESMVVSSKEIALISMLGTISAVLRVPFAALPAVQPCTFLIICTGYVFGPVAGFMVGAMTALVSNFFLGHGPWTSYQMLAWGLVGITAGFLRRLNLNIFWLIVLGVAWGFLYGWITNTWFWASFIYPLNWKTFITYQANSIWFDTFHAIGNGIFMALLGIKTISILERFRKRFSWIYDEKL